MNEEAVSRLGMKFPISLQFTFSTSHSYVIIIIIIIIIRIRIIRIIWPYDHCYHQSHCRNKKI